jgi:hypothetical protein
MKMEVENMYTHIPVSTNAVESMFLRMDFPVKGRPSQTTLEPGKTHHIPIKFAILDNPRSKCVITNAPIPRSSRNTCNYLQA